MTARRVDLNDDWVLVAGDAGGAIDVRAGVPTLHEVHWAITGACNLACRHCFMEAPSGRYPDLGHDAALGFITQFERAGVEAVSLTGGEPFLRADLFDILGELRRRGIRVTEIATNGVLLSDAVLGRLAETGHRPRLKISFDGCGAHDAMRGVAGTEQRVTDAIRRAVRSPFDAAVVTTVDALNLASLDATYQRMKELAVPIWMVAPAQSTGNYRGSTPPVSTEHLAASCLRIVRKWQADGRPIGILLGTFFGGGPATPMGRRWEDRPAVPPAPYTAESLECRSCRQSAFLLPDGTLLPCPGFTGTPLAASMPNLFVRELQDVWADSSLRGLADMTKHSVLSRQPECAACEWFPKCGAGCRAFALSEAGDLLAKDPRACDLWKGGYREQFRQAVEAGRP